MRSSVRLDRWARATDGPLLVLAAAFLVVLLVPLYQPDLPASERTALRTANVALWGVFGADYVVRLWLAPSRKAYVRRHVPDLLTLVVPFLRPLRLLRVVGLLGAASRRASDRRLYATSAYVVTGVAVLLVVSGGLVLDAERGVEGSNIATPGDALWWAATTVSTVGYGDRYPTTGEGRLVAAGLMLGGIALLGVVTATFAAWFVKRFSALEVTEVDVELIKTDLAREAAMTAASLSDIAARLERIERALELRGSGA
jgi:voltage-gated potassium channel